MTLDDLKKALTSFVDSDWWFRAFLWRIIIAWQILEGSLFFIINGHCTLTFRKKTVLPPFCRVHQDSQVKRICVCVWERGKGRQSVGVIIMNKRAICHINTRCFGTDNGGGRQTNEWGCHQLYGTVAGMVHWWGMHINWHIHKYRCYSPLNPGKVSQIIVKVQSLAQIYIDIIFCTQMYIIPYKSMYGLSDLFYMRKVFLLILYIYSYYMGHVV